MPHIKSEGSCEICAKKINHHQMTDRSQEKAPEEPHDSPAQKQPQKPPKVDQPPLATDGPKQPGGKVREENQEAELFSSKTSKLRTSFVSKEAQLAPTAKGPLLSRGYSLSRKEGPPVTNAELKSFKLSNSRNNNRQKAPARSDSLFDELLRKTEENRKFKRLNQPENKAVAVDEKDTLPKESPEEVVVNTAATRNDLQNVDQLLKQTKPADSPKNPGIILNVLDIPTLNTTDVHQETDDHKFFDEAPGPEAEAETKFSLGQVMDMLRAHSITFNNCTINGFNVQLVPKPETTKNDDRRQSEAPTLKIRVKGSVQEL